jgi:uncharacterized protein (TIGR03435 family)
MTHPARGRMFATGTLLKSIVTMASRSNVSRMAFETELPDVRYDVRFVMPAGMETQLFPKAEEAVEAAFGLEIVREKRSVPVYVMRAPDGPKGDLKASTGTGFKNSSGPGVFTGKANPMSSIVASTENVIGLPIIDETKLQGNYDYLVTFTPGDPASIIQSLAEMGLQLKKETREIEITVVRKKA